MSASHYVTLEPCAFDASLLAVMEYVHGLKEVVCYVPDHRHGARILDAIAIAEGLDPDPAFSVAAHALPVIPGSEEEANG